jgi:hypothetical protein
MKYILLIGIEYKFFKKPADITIHIDDKLIDTFQLTRDYPCTTNILTQIESKWFVKGVNSKWVEQKDWIKKWQGIPSLFKVYEIDDSDIKAKMEIGVQNNNSDYTNGFMKNSSLIKFPLVALFKKELVENRGEKLMKALAKFDGALGKGINFLDKPYPGYIRSSWPIADSFYISRENEIHEQNGPSDSHWDIGGSFTAEFRIRTKHHMKVFAPAVGRVELGILYSTPVTYPKKLVCATCKPLLNIYNEDQ